MKSSLARNVLLLILGVSSLYVLAMLGLDHLQLLPGAGWLRKLLYALGPFIAVLYIPRVLMGMFGSVRFGLSIISPCRKPTIWRSADLGHTDRRTLCHGSLFNSDVASGLPERSFFRKLNLVVPCRSGRPAGPVPLTGGMLGEERWS